MQLTGMRCALHWNLLLHLLWGILYIAVPETLLG